ncbi:MAG: metallophosphoesterase [Bacteroidales bacterium]|jgi:Icc-related predicted phosphoesterase|nr:metallophosphoesterase [Bacteroidales bacterium]
MKRRIFIRTIGQNILIPTVALDLFSGCSEEPEKTDPPVEISVDPGELNHTIGAEGGIIRVTVVCSGKFSIRSSAEGWCTASYYNSYVADNLHIKVGENESTVQRTAEIELSGGGTENVIITIAQEAAEASGENDLPRFAVISDTHFGSNEGGPSDLRNVRALKSIFSDNRRLDALFVVGDLTDNGEEFQYNILKTVYDNPENVPTRTKVYFMMGNHDNYNRTSGISLYLDKLRQPLYQYVVIKGYPFITISGTGPGEDDYNTEARAFLEANLADAKAKYPGKPIFVFMHHPPRDTTYGSESVNGWGTAIFSSILSRYPQIIIFAGHTHYPLGDPRSIHQDKFTTVNDGSTNYAEMETGSFTIGTKPEHYNQVTEGVIVNIRDSGDVELQRWDTRRNEEILPRWTVEAPHDGSRFIYRNRNGQPAPVFAAGAKPLVTVSGENATVTYPQATDNEVVHRYLIEILSGETLLASYRQFSQFYLNSEMPETLSADFSDLPAGGELKASVKAIDSYGNVSNAIVSDPFTVDAGAPPVKVAEWKFDDTSDLTKATVGAALQFVETGGAITSVAGPSSGDMAVSVPKESHIKALHGLQAVGGSKVNRYAIMIDFKVATIGPWYSLLQTDLTQTDQNGDADIYINETGHIGIGDGIGYSTSAIQANRWYRLIISFNAGKYCNFYLNGALFHTGGATAVDGRYALDPAGVLFFAEPNHYDETIEVAAIAIWDKPLNLSEAEAEGSL